MPAHARPCFVAAGGEPYRATERPHTRAAMLYWRSAAGNRSLSADGASV